MSGETLTSAFPLKRMGHSILEGGGLIQTGPFGSQLHARDYVVRGIPVVMPQDITNGRISDQSIAMIDEAAANRLARHRMMRGDVIFSRRGDLSRCAVVSAHEVGWLCGTGCLLVRIGNSNLTPDWLAIAYRAPHCQRQVAARAVGTTMLNMNTSLLSDLVIPCPNVLEQRRAVSILEQFDGAIAHTEDTIEKLHAARRGVLHVLLPLEPFSFLASPTCPRGWALASLSSLGAVSSGVTLGRKIAPGPGTIALPYLRVANVQDGFLDLTEVKTTRVYAAELPRFALAPGDVLMNEGGDWDKLGRGTVWRGEIPACLHQNHVFRVRLDTQRILPDYLAALSASDYGRRYFALCSKQTTNLASINSTQLNAFPIPVPSLAEQQRIVAILDAHDARIRAEQAERDKLVALKRGLLDDLLTGRVRVPLSETATPRRPLLE